MKNQVMNFIIIIPFCSTFDLSMYYTCSLRSHSLQPHSILVINYYYNRMKNHKASKHILQILMYHRRGKNMRCIGRITVASRSPKIMILTTCNVVALEFSKQTTILTISNTRYLINEGGIARCV